MVKTFEILSLLSASIAFAVTVARLLDTVLVREKAKRVFREQKILDAKLRVNLRSDDIIKAEKALKELRELVGSDKKIGTSFSSREKKVLKTLLADRAGARFLSY